MKPVNAQIGKDRIQLVQNSAGHTFVNVATTSEAGIQWAKENNFSSSGLADVVSSHLFNLTVENLLSKENKGKAFTILRHPIDRALSTFFYLGSESAKHERNYNPAYKNMTIAEYLQSNSLESDWMTRKLNGDLRGKVLPEHVEHAKQILGTKFLIGLLSQFEESLHRFATYFRWKLPKDYKQCIENIVNEGGANKNTAANSYYREKVLQPSSPEYQLLLQYNQYDLQLYQFGEQLFKEQRRHFLN
jgi:hypothetical protein